MQTIEPCFFAKVEDLPQGEFVQRKPGAAAVYRRGQYDRSQGRYQLDDYNDSSRCIYVKRGTVLYFGFTY
jgi:hypothetical protein